MLCSAAVSWVICFFQVVVFITSIIAGDKQEAHEL